jgi:ketosteroid isomerase-like protein
MGTAQLEIKKPDGSVVGKDTAKYIVIWKREAGGDWQWYRDIWNSNLPATAGK